MVEPKSSNKHMSLAMFSLKSEALVISKLLIQILHSNPQSLRDSSAQDELIVKARQFINRKNATSHHDPARAGLQLASRMALFDAEARAQTEWRQLLEAYLWHRHTAKGQHSTQELFKHLPGRVQAYFHFDFNENVRYPMSKKQVTSGTPKTN